MLTETIVYDDAKWARMYDSLGDNDETDPSAYEEPSDDDDGYNAMEDVFQHQDDGGQMNIDYSSTTDGAKAYGAGHGARHAAGGDAPTQGEAKKAVGGGFQRKPSVYSGFESESPTQSKHDTLIAIPKGNVMSRMKAFENADC